MSAYLVLLTTSPYHGSQFSEAIDLMLTLAAFDQSVSILILDQAVWGFIDHQQIIDQRQSTAGIIQGLSFYGIEQIYLEIESMTQYHLKPDQFILPLQFIHRDQVNSLMNQYTHLISL
ncbi:MAG: hypothetical protein RL637_396 [Pseudomonadota bacterium]|jgi:tRNA 2-thiouridine synthesizing protein C